MATAAAPAEQPGLPDELVEEIFLRLDAAADLARAAAACSSFRRVVSARRFLRRFRSLHPPPVLGCIARGFQAAEPPHPSAPAARALALAADFTFSFLPNPDWWSVCDARDGRVLLLDRANISPFPALVVCDPLHRRYVKIPPIPGDLAAYAGDRANTFDSNFLEPASKEEKDGEDGLSFRLICAVHSYQKLVTFHFSSATRKWRGMTFDRSTPLQAPVSAWGLIERHYAHGCFYFTYSGVLSLFMLDAREMKFSFLDHHLPIKYGWKELAIVEAGEGRLGLLTCGHGMLDLYSTTLPNNGAGTVEWRHHKIIPLPEPDCHWYILGAADGHVLLQAIRLFGTLQRMTKAQYFTMNIKTLLVERLCASDHRIFGAHLYASFLPPLSLRSI